jgi:hypothetical protein
MLEIDAKHYLEGIATGNESWFQYSSCSDSMFAGSKETLVSKIRQNIFGQKSLSAIVFTSRRLLVLEALPKGTKFNQNYFIRHRTELRISRYISINLLDTHLTFCKRMNPRIVQMDL